MTNEIRRIRKKLEILNQEGAKQLLFDFINFPDDSIDIETFNILFLAYKRKLDLTLKKILPKTEQLKLNL